MQKPFEDASFALKVGQMSHISALSSPRTFAILKRADPLSCFIDHSLNRIWRTPYLEDGLRTNSISITQLTSSPAVIENVFYLIPTHGALRVTLARGLRCSIFMKSLYYNNTQNRVSAYRNLSST